MLKNLEIQNFRSLQDTSVKKLRRLNLVTGRNGGGKTSLLEAIFLNAGSGNPQLLFSLNSFRGDQVLHAENDRAFSTCFYDMDPRRVVRITADEQLHGRSRSRVFIMNAKTQTQTLPGRSSPETFVSGVRIRFSGPGGTSNSSAEFDFSGFANVTAGTAPPAHGM
jgi:recombinational DNA repair ATPase RecF